MPRRKRPAHRMAAMPVSPLAAGFLAVHSVLSGHFCPKIFAMKTLRVDAAARREQILEAAYQVFAEQGVTVPLDVVVERAGVGRATLYRNFPDRTALIRALLERSVGALEQLAQRNADRDDALFILFARMARNIVRSAPLSDYWRAMDHDDPFVLTLRHRVQQIFKAPLTRACAAGLCRSDLQLADISLISGMLGAALRGRSANERQALARRALQLLRDGITAAPPAA